MSQKNVEIELPSLIESGLVPAYAKKFNISEIGSKEFLIIAMEKLAKTNYRLEVSGQGQVRGDPEKIKKFILEIATWDEEEFDLEDFEVIGYCKNIR